METEGVLLKLNRTKIYRSHGLLWFAKSQNDSKQNVHVKLIIKFYLFPKTECLLPAKYLAIFILFVYGCMIVCFLNRESFIYVQNKLPKNIFLFHFYSNLLHLFWFSGCAICPLFDYFKRSLFRHLRKMLILGRHSSLFLFIYKYVYVASSIVCVLFCVEFKIG